MFADIDTSLSRTTVGWWLLTFALAAMLAFVAYSFVGTLVLGLFAYYGTRPLYRRVRTVTPSDGLAAISTLLLTLLPLFLVVAVVAVVGLNELSSVTGGQMEALLQALPGNQNQEQVQSMLDQPRRVVDAVRGGQVQGMLTASVGVLGAVANGLLHLSLSFAIGYFLLRDGDQVADWFRSDVAEPGTAAYGYVTAVDRDLETLYFGNILLIFVVAVLATGVYHAYNLVAPDPVTIPLAALLALLTGLATLVPIVVGKLVYIPLVLALLVRAFQASGNLVVYPLGLLVVSFLLLDILPQTVLRPYISGRKIHTGLVMFSYIMGTMLFGWYGLFLGPLVLVLSLQLIRIAFAELLHGESVSPETTMEALGSSPETDADVSGE
ncbi:AI-2E family transporter [Haloprofundus sp. MHR1]|uniref:AI-2E family transporter n=1 Tax=Haloprofundus sp. MHR1 TaxID=2572921 RepID=UPI0010BEE9A4|nr:AI-2E family transporter [Haloprofundus sp. MHR1]QCJ46302.1 AI-2E family transporter [Haloprofundus sp. MHR1]